jgi:hypothetical protein
MAKRCILPIESFAQRQRLGRVANESSSFGWHVDELCFIHSLQADTNNHGPASYQLHTNTTHNAAGFTVWLAGGGVRAGTRIGATDEIGLMATERPIPFRDLHATILTALGLDHETLSFEISGS